MRNCFDSAIANEVFALAADGVICDKYSESVYVVFLFPRNVKADVLIKKKNKKFQNLNNTNS